MKHIGIVACSHESTAYCYQAICRAAAQRIGAFDHPRITIDAIPFARWKPAFDAGDVRSVGQIMLESARVLAAAGAELAICPANTAHLAWDFVVAESPIPWLHIARVVAVEAQQRGYRRIAVLGTQLTMRSSLYSDALGNVGIAAVSPDDDDIASIDRIIFDELLRGLFTTASRATYNAVIARLRDRGCDAVALACTEIPLLVRADESPLPTLDSTSLLAAAALREAMAGRLERV